MKFARDFSSALEREEYPPQWVQSAISYRRLKKCVRKVQEELSALGLDADTLNTLWQSVPHDGMSSLGNPKAVQEGQFSYRFNGGSKSFLPKLTFVVDPTTGSPRDCWLSPETKKYLLSLRESQRRHEPLPSATPEGEEGPQPDSEQASTCSRLESSSEHADGEIWDVAGDGAPAKLQTVEIPLTSDSKFFQILSKELADLNTLQQREKEKLAQDISRVGDEVSALSNSSMSGSKSDVYAWREIFQLYMESQIFISTGERDAGPRSAASAQQQLQKFTATLSRRKKGLKIKKESKATLDRFLRVNVELLRVLKFDEINRLALAKIMKKFDKRTALHAKASLPAELSAGDAIAQSMAKAVCFKISEGVLDIIPQLSDYLCPICFSISFKPIRLRCNHIFCIRCLIVMQRTNQDHCPMCRGNVVMEASSHHMDEELMRFLKTNFPKEVKAKQKENERAVGVDRYGEDFDKCAVM